MWDATKETAKRTFIPLSVSNKKKIKVSNQSSKFIPLEIRKGEQIIPQLRRMEKIIKSMYHWIGK